MSNEEKKQKQKEYNDIPVFYCKRCLSLNILNYDGGLITCYCKDCTSIDIDTAHIDEWIKMYNEKHKQNPKVINKK